MVATQSSTGDSTQSLRRYAKTRRGKKYQQASGEGIDEGGKEAGAGGVMESPQFARTAAAFWDLPDGKRLKSRECCNCGDEALADMKAKVWVHEDHTTAGIYCERTERVK